MQFSSSKTLSGKVHPLVIFNICDSYVRRPDQAERVIGTLLGSVLPDGTVDIRNSYADLHNEIGDQVLLDIEYHQNMLLSHQKVNPKEVIVGWYSTGLGVTGGSALIHDFYSREVSNPIHLTVDTGFANGEGTIKAYVSNNLSLGDQQIAAQFQEIPLDLRMVEAERIG
ncbi:eukaryotic translation initiation factor 3 subunit f-like protein, partial [Trifolium pratense]